MKALRNARQAPLAIAATRVPVLVLVLVSMAAGPGLARRATGRIGRTTGAAPGSIHVDSVALLGEVRLAPGGRVLGTPLGGLSAITYDAAHDGYYAQSDDRSQRAAARFYGVTIDLADGRLEDGDIAFTRVVTLTNPSGQAFANGSIDPEGIAYAATGSVYVSSEGSAGAGPPLPPWVDAFDLSGRWLSSVPVPAVFLPAAGRGVRDNLAFEPLALSPGGSRLITASESALAQDGPIASAAAGSPARLLVWDLPGRNVVAEYVYPVSPWPVPPDPPTASADNGLVELVPLDEGRTFIAMERAYAAGVGNTVRLFETSTAGATDVAGIPALVDPATGMPIAYRPMTKRLIADIAGLGVKPDNIEGATFGPSLPDGRRILVLVSDDNFNAAQVTQFVALAVQLVVVEDWWTCYLPVAFHRR